MKKILVIVSTLFTTSFAFAGEDAKPVQTICAEQVKTAAEFLFKLNTKESEFTSKMELIDLAHVEEGGYEVYDVIFTAKDLTYSAYRITANIDKCSIINFEMPFAN